MTQAWVDLESAANKAFAISLALWAQLAEDRLSWGTFLDLACQAGGADAGSTALQARGGAQDEGGQAWLENTVTCYLQAIRHGSTEGRGMMARILNLLSFHDTNGVVSQAIRKHGRQVAAPPTSPIGCFLTLPYPTLLCLHWSKGEPKRRHQYMLLAAPWFWLRRVCDAVQVPLNNWLPYLAQLQTSLQRAEAPVVKDLLSQLATAFPQAVYYGLRTILLSLREVCTSAVVLRSVTSGGENVCGGMAVLGLQQRVLRLSWKMCGIHLTAARGCTWNSGCQLFYEQAASYSAGGGEGCQ